MGHGKLAVNCFLVKTIRSLSENHPTIERIDFFSDGAFIFLQELVKVSIHRNFFPMSYGKCVIERIGGYTKRVVVGSCDDALEISFL